jgi:hypothetical protein
MGASNVHPLYTANLKNWTKCRDVVEGKERLHAKDTIRAGVSEYLLIPSGLNAQEFANYSERAAFFGATARTIDAFVGLIMAKPATVEAPPQTKKLLEDITLSGIPLRDFTQHILREEMTTTRAGILVDVSTAQLETKGLTVAQVQKLNIRPSMHLYKAEQITDWDESVVNGKRQTSRVNLMEEYTERSEDDEFLVETKLRFRVLDLYKGQYRVRVFAENDSQIGEESYPLMDGKRMDFIPFRPVGGIKPRKPLSLDMVNTNIHHYRNSADYEHALHFTALPTPIITGVSITPEQDSFKIGSLSAWVFDNPDARATFLEFQGQGLEAIQSAMKEKEFQLSVLGARMLADEKRASESEGTVQIRTAGERSILSSTADDVADAIRDCLRWAAMWSGEDASNIRYALNVDYGSNKLDSKHIKTLVDTWQRGGITHLTLFENLQRGDIIASDEKYDDYQDKLKTTEFNFTVTPSKEPAPDADPTNP